VEETNEKKGERLVVAKAYSSTIGRHLFNKLGVLAM